MAQQDAFALGRSDLNGFLFADIGVEGSGMSLSVISALARQGLDPWEEAGRLARLPRMVAADGLARLIAAMPASPWPMPDATAIAARLVALLPGRDGRSLHPSPVVFSNPLSVEKTRPSGPWLMVAILAMALLAGLAAAVAPAPAQPRAAPPSVAAPIHPVPTGD